MSMYYYYYLGYWDENHKLVPYGPYDDEGNLHKLFWYDYHSSIEVHNGFNTLSVEDFSDRFLSVIQSLFGLNDGDMLKGEWISNMWAYIELKDFVNGITSIQDLIKTGYWPIEEMLEFLSASEEDRADMLFVTIFHNIEKWRFMTMKYRKMSRTTCERYCTQNHLKTSVIISIKTSWDKESPQLYCDKKNNVKDILFLSFDDTEDSRYGMQESDGVKVAEFVHTYLNVVDVIIIHCDGGISRSAGVLYALLFYYERVDKTNKVHNELAYNVTIKSLKQFNKN